MLERAPRAVLGESATAKETHLSHQFHHPAFKREPECLKTRGKRIAVWHRLLYLGKVSVLACFLGFLFVFKVCFVIKQESMKSSLL